MVMGSIAGGVTSPSLSVNSSNEMKWTSLPVLASCLAMANGANRRLAKGSALGSEQTMMRRNGVRSNCGRSLATSPSRPIVTMMLMSESRI